MTQPPSSLAGRFRDMLAMFSPRDRRRLWLLFAGMVAMAFLEMVGVASIMPFMALLQDPRVIEKSRLFARLAALAGTQDILTLQSLAGALTLLLLLVSNGAALTTNWLLLRFVHMHGHRMAGKLLLAYMSQPYEFFLGRNTSELGKNLLAEVERVTSAVIVPTLQLLAKVIVVLFMVALLMLVDPVLAIGSASVIGGIYGAIYLMLCRRLKTYGLRAVQERETLYKATSEALGGIKEIKVSGRQHVWEKKFSDASLRLAHDTTLTESIKFSPKYVLEVIAFGGIVLIALYLLHHSRDPAQVLPIVALYSFAGYRLMPAMQQIYSSLIQIRCHGHVLDLLQRDLALLPKKKPDSGLVTPLPFERELRMTGVSYAYPGAGHVLHDITLAITPNTTIGIAGMSGAGKTTLVDIFLGLLTPALGSMEVDGVAITGDTIGAWRGTLGYVPQQLYLADDSIAANIAFGIPPAEVDDSRVERAARLAHLHEFIGTLPQGYGTLVGERGIRLSGGQRQRIGIARALYGDPKLLILDEATSALDNLTESAVMEAIGELSGKKTIVIIAHRLTTLLNCDCIYLMQGGRIAASGNYRELMEHSREFRTLAMAQEKDQAA